MSFLHCAPLACMSKIGWLWKNSLLCEYSFLYHGVALCLCLLFLITIALQYNWKSEMIMPLAVFLLFRMLCAILWFYFCIQFNIWFSVPGKNYTVILKGTMLYLQILFYWMGIFTILTRTAHDQESTLYFLLPLSIFSLSCLIAQFSHFVD